MVLVDVLYVGNGFVVKCMKEAATKLRFYDVHGNLARELDLEGMGNVSDLTVGSDGSECLFSFETFTTPGTIYRWRVCDGKCTKIQGLRTPCSDRHFSVEHVFYGSKDGTRIPMYLIHGAEITRDGRNPTLIQGYGGFGVASLPEFRPEWIVWLEMGGILAIPGIRGGGENGEPWHLSATKAQKQRSFDDFIAAAEWLISQGYTSPTKLAIEGCSNGGLLVGVASTQRPDLFAACVTDRGLLDVLRHPRRTRLFDLHDLLMYRQSPWSEKWWPDEYGSATDPTEFRVLLGYSPYHNLRAHTRYPAQLLTVGLKDSIVSPSNSFKFVAALRHIQSRGGTILLRLQPGADHRLPGSAAVRFEQAVDELTFLAKELRMQVRLQSKEDRILSDLESRIAVPFFPNPEP
jgi:prolyl oligopeptidase